MTASAFSLTNLVNKIFGDCRLISQIGKGAMGVVYLADQEKLGRKVAIKILDPKFGSDPSYIKRFEVEAQAAAKLSHENIVKVYDYGNEQGLYYIINEYVDNGTIQELLNKNGPLAPEKAVEYAIQVTKGLIEARKLNIVHRDIKPENLMLTKTDVLKIADFGLAKFMQSDAATTQSGLILGTPFYMSPEQAKGLPMDSRSDVYSLGVSLYCMVIGAVPFDADSVVGVLLKQISADRPDPCAINPSLPPVFGALIMRMMDKDPANRQQTPEALLNELDAVQQILRPAAPPASLLEATQVSQENRKNFAPLPTQRITRILRVEASSDVITRMITSITGDTGVAIDLDNPFPPNTVVEVRFNVPGREDELSGLGLVRWIEGRTMGITFVKVQPVPKAGRNADLRLSGPMAIGPLTATPIHQRLLRYVYANAGQVVAVSQVAGALGVGVRMTEDPISTFERASMIKRQGKDKLELIWPKDEALQKEIVIWMGRNGLKG
ncbi:MAG: serine/threonine protein kinase [Planctomycetota bacterium]|jgi:serine/threonine protein kinase|nr:serine/threonine protein kinase [Planctomycetota bacterium]